MNYIFGDKELKELLKVVFGLSALEARSYLDHIETYLQEHDLTISVDQD